MSGSRAARAFTRRPIEGHHWVARSWRGRARARRGCGRAMGGERSACRRPRCSARRGIPRPLHLAPRSGAARPLVEGSAVDREIGRRRKQAPGVCRKLPATDSRYTLSPGSRSRDRRPALGWGRRDARYECSVRCKPSQEDWYEPTCPRTTSRAKAPYDNVTEGRVLANFATAFATALARDARQGRTKRQGAV
jgi:hypothetical protein